MKRSAGFALLLAMLIGVPANAQTIVEFDLPSNVSVPAFISAGPDGAMWFTLFEPPGIGRISADGTITTFPVPSRPIHITAGPDNNLWFGMVDSQIGRLTPAGVLTLFSAGAPANAVWGITSGTDGHLWYGISGSIRRMNVQGQVVEQFAIESEAGLPAMPRGVTASPDGSIWFADQRANGRGRIGRIRGGVVTLFDLPVGSDPFQITSAAEGGVWFTDFSRGLGRMSNTGAVTYAGFLPADRPYGVVQASDGAIWTTLNFGNGLGRVDPSTNAETTIPTPTANSRPGGIAMGPDGSLWFTEALADKIGRLDTAATVEEADLEVTIMGDTFVRTESPVHFLDQVVTIRNRGTREARDVQVLVELPLAFIVEPVYTLSRGTCDTSGQIAACSLGTIAAGATATIAYEQSGGVPAPTATAEAQTSSPESNLSNNVAFINISTVSCERLNNCPLFDILATAICESRLFSKGNPVPSSSRRNRPSLASRAVRLLKRIVPTEDLPFDPQVFSRLRDEVFARTAAGRRYTEIYYTHGLEIAGIYFFNPEVGMHATETLQLWQEPIRALVEGSGNTAIITAEQIAALQRVLDDLKRLGSDSLRETIEAEETKLPLATLPGQTMNQALALQTLTAPATVTLPASASLRGASTTFFHSDVRVFNPAIMPAEVTARYRCLSGSCGNSEQTFTLGPREMRTFEDMPGTFFAAAESAGAVEFEGAVSVDSRLYTPEAGAPTTGMYVPALTAGEAYAESVLTSLSHSTDGSRGFRTNVGVYNPNDVALDVRFRLFDRLGVLLGELVRNVPARTPLQINNTFAAAGVTADTEGAYAIVSADGVRELFAYASVIDNQSQDLVFIAGRNGRRGEITTATLPAAASLHGVPPTFFHSDVTVLNPSEENAVTVSAEYRCFAPPCGTGTASFELAPGESRVFEDAVVSLFAAPETAGAIELTGGVLVDSRLYTPSRPAPSSGMYIPALEDVQAYAESVLLSLSHSTDGRSGFRTNAGVYNPNLTPLEVTFTIFDPSGTQLGEVTRTVPARTPVQINNTFAAAGITVEVPNAYCVVRADGARKLFAYASVIDNRSQDLIFVRGVDANVPLAGQ